MTRRLGLGSALAGLLAGALTFAAPPATAADPAYQAPVVGQCFDMSPEELAAASYTEAAVDCATTHTSQVIAVVQMPTDLTYESAGLELFALESCLSAQRDALGTGQVGVRLTAFNLGYFSPTPEQQAAGARWLRCDLVLGNDADLRPLPGTLTIGRYPFADSVARCLTGRDFHLTVCTDRHTHRATGAIRISQYGYPGGRKRQRVGTQRCRPRTSSRTFRFGWPSRAAWEAGDHTLICYTKTRR